LAVGFGVAMGNINTLALIICSYFTGVIAVIFGSYLGNKISKKTNLDLSWLSGVILIILAFSKIM